MAAPFYLSAPSSTLSASGKSDPILDQDRLLLATLLKLQDEGQAPQRPLPRAAAAPAASALAKTAPTGWEYNPLWESRGIPVGFSQPVTNGQPRYITTEDYLRRYATADPNKQEQALMHGNLDLQYDPRAADSPLRREAVQQQGFDQFEKIRLLEQLMSRLQGGQQQQRKPIQISGISDDILNPIRQLIL